MIRLRHKVVWPNLETLSGLRSSRMAAGRAGNSPSLVSQ
jgi:hypothetical protein